MAIAAVTALAGWVSVGALAVTGAGVSASRVGLLPAWWFPLVVFALAAAVLLVVRRGSGPWPLALAGVLVLPWLPFPVPDSFLAWAGPITWWVWAGALAILAARLLQSPASRLAKNLDGWRAPAAAAVAAFVIYCAAAWQVSAVMPGGDEPHYLVITQSLLSDGDLRIENNHQRGDYRQYFDGTLRPDYLRRGQNGEIYSIHAPGLSALVAPAFAAGGYPGVVVFLALVSALGSLLVWVTGFRLTRSQPAAWFGWASVTLTVPFFFHAFAVYPDATGAALVMTGVYALVSLDAAGFKPGGHEVRAGFPLSWLLHGLALAALPWLHTRYALAAGVLGASLVLRLAGRRAWRELAAFLAIPLPGALAWFSFFFIVYGTWSPAAPYGTYTQSQLSNIPRALPALLFDQQFGVLPNAPAYAFGVLGFVVLFRVRRRLAVELLLLLAGYLAAVSAYHMWWGGWSAPARFAVPVLLTLGPLAAVSWKERGHAARAAGIVALFVSLLVTASLTFVNDGWLIFNTRDGFARWLEWVSPLVDLPRALPSFLRDGPRVALQQAAIWVTLMGAAAWLLGRLRGARTGRHEGPPLQTRPHELRSQDDPVTGRRESLPLVSASLVFTIAVMVSLSINWWVRRTPAVTATSAQLELLRAYDPALRPVGVALRPPAAGPAAAVVPRLRLSRSTRRPPSANDPLLSLADLPAGRYQADDSSIAAARGEVSATVGRSDRPLQQWRLDPGEERGSFVLDLPVSVNALTLAADSRARASIPEFVLRPLEVVPPAERVAPERARRAARYGELDVFSFDDYAYLEEPGLWIRGSTPVRIVLVGSSGPRGARLLLRNGPNQNQVRLQSGGWSVQLPLASREERIVEVPLPAGRAALDIRTETGFRPSQAEPGSTDHRYLGVWIEAVK